MKNQFNITHFFLCLLLIQAACHKEDPKPPTELEKLPPATTEGKNTFGCLVNGDAFVAKTSIDARAIYQNNFLIVSGSTNEEITQSLRMRISKNIVIGKKYLLTDLQNSDAWFITDNYFTKDRCEYLESNTIDGHMILTRFDLQKMMVSGTFEFRTVSDQCDSVKVTDGRFDLSLML